MKKMIIAATFAFMAIVFAACSGGTGKAESKDSGASTMATDTAGKMMAAVKYTCKMHPEVISDTPGKCPKCGMALVKMDEKDMKMDTTKH